MARPTTRQELIEYCLRKLGKPVLNINVAPEQVEDRVDEALETYTEKHFDASVEEWASYPITQLDIDNGYITLPDDILTVIEVMDVSSMFNQTGMFSFQYQVAVNQLSPWRAFDSVDYFMKITNYNSISDMTNVAPRFQFIRHGNRIRVDQQLVAGHQLGIKVQRILDPDTYTSVWNDKWLKEYATALIKRQWGENMKKFGGIQLLGGVELNGQQLFDEALQEIQELEEALQETYTLPTDFIVG